MQAPAFRPGLLTIDNGLLFGCCLGGFGGLVNDKRVGHQGHKLRDFHVKLGVLDEVCSDWGREIQVTTETGSRGLPVTTLAGVFDQAALHSLLRRLYALGLPLLSVICVDCR